MIDGTVPAFALPPGLAAIHCPWHYLFFFICMIRPLRTNQEHDRNNPYLDHLANANDRFLDRLFDGRL